MSLHMLSIAVNPGRLFEWARREAGLPLEDEGYLLHLATRKAFESMAPQPFALRRDRFRNMTLLGYGQFDADELRAEMAMLATPLLAEAFPSKKIASKVMPEAWPKGRSFGFDVLCCPVRRGKADQGTAEHDVYLRERAKTPGVELDRDTVYRDWLAGELARFEAADLAMFRVEAVNSFHPVRRSKGRPKRMSHPRPAVNFSGTLSIRDPVGFTSLLARGLGRHRAFGFGMLLLRKSGR